METVSQELDELLSSIEGLGGSEDPDEKTARSNRLLGGLFRIVGKLNSLLQPNSTAPTQPISIGTDILEAFDEWVVKIKQALYQLAKILSAQSYTIAFSIPLGLQVSITFTP
jgi:hypothetical protein